MKDESDLISFRKSHIILILKLALFELVIIAFYLIVRVPKSYILPLFINITDKQFLDSLGIIYYITLSVIELFIVLKITLDWSNEEYKIKDEALIHKRGILKLTQETYTLRNLGSAKIYQGFVGKLFNFGSIIVTSPILKSDIVLSDIHDPHKILNALENHLDNSAVKNANIIRRNFNK